MRLTSAHREAFVSAVMRDVPQIDYHDLIEKVIEQDIIKSLPAKVVAVYKDPELRHYLINANHRWDARTSKGDYYGYLI